MVAAGQVLLGACGALLLLHLLRRDVRSHDVLASPATGPRHPLPLPLTAPSPPVHAFGAESPQIPMAGGTPDPLSAFQEGPGEPVPSSGSAGPPQPGGQPRRGPGKMLGGTLRVLAALLVAAVMGYPSRRSATDLDATPRTTVTFEGKGGAGWVPGGKTGRKLSLLSSALRRKPLRDFPP